ncbi:site-specific integrase [Flagellimonas sp. 389]|uniref:site-specific integrase n=1 Tax=Flagellimonas sp. 389 TaxID=2835862 RepID=UPI001BD1C8D8|nr:site-specific integrase [Flagellimonas sp. 389]MBS9461653.1 site-specific integrase [Flagellimonas sp. 389]
MRTSNTFAILFWAYSTRAKNNLTGMYARITVNGKKVNISLKQQVDVRVWDSKRQRAKGNSETTRALNSYLDQVHAQLVQLYQDLKFKGQLITAELIKAEYLGESDNSKTLQNLLEYHNKKTEKTLAVGTLRNFRVTEGYLNKYLNNVLNTSDIFLKELNYKFICDFANFLICFWPKGHLKAMSNNTVMKHIQRFRKIITLGYHIEWIDKDPFVRWKPTYEKRERPFLTENELSNIETYHLPIARLERVRDLFIFSCYTGIAYIDIMNLTNDNILKGIDGNDWIFMNRQKTKSPVKVPLLGKAKELLIKYESHPMTEITGTLFPVITNEKVNLYLKEIAEACGLKKNLTFHMARHTFATTVTLSNGVPIETVSKLLGHSKIASTQVYARVVERKVSQDMLALRNKIEAPDKNELQIKHNM